MRKVDLRTIGTLSLIATSLASACGGSDGGALEGNDPTVTRVVVTPANGMVPLGQLITFSAEASYSDGSTADVTARATWSSGNDLVLARRANSEFRAVAEGMVTVSATFEDVVGTADVLVTPSPLSALEITPATATLEVNERRQLAAIGTFANGASDQVTSRIEWVSSDPSIATVSAGRVTGVAPGNAVITGREGTVSATAQVLVSVPRVVELDIRGPTGALPTGDTRQLTAEATLSSGATVAITADVVWSSNAPQVATVGNDAATAGLVTGVGEGRARITAVHGPSGLDASRDVVVAPAVLERVEVRPAAVETSAGEFVFMAAVGVLSDGSQETLTARVQWRSSDPAVATVDNSFEKGRVTALAAGTTRISVVDPESGLDSGEMGSATITVNPARLTSIQIEPGTGMTPAGRTFQFEARANFSDGSSRIVTNGVEWRSASPGVATVDASGLATGLMPGTTEISARDAQSGVSSGALSATLQVQPPVVEQIDVTLTPPVLAATQVRRAEAIGRFSDGSTGSVRDNVAWSSSDNAVVIASAGGFLRAFTAGTATITATDPVTQAAGSMVVRVEALRQVSVQVTPSRLVLPAGAEAAFRVDANFNNGDVIELTSTATYTNSNPAVIDRGRRGNRANRVFALASGSARLTALDSTTGNRGQLDVTVSATLTLSRLAVSSPASFVGRGLSNQLRALGTFNNGDVYDMTHAVRWASSVPARATVSNDPVSAGVLTGVQTGTTAIQVVFGAVPPFVTSPPLLITVQEPIVSGSWNGPTRSVDGTGFTRVDVGSVTFSAADFGTGATVADVDILVDFLKTDGSCANPASGSAFHNETHFTLRAPTGTRVNLATPGTWSGQTAINNVQVTFDDSATARPANIPQSGTFLPSQALSGFNGLNPVGTWVLEAGDTAGADPLCVNAYTITVTSR